MNREELYDAITQVDERYIEETAADIQKGRRQFRLWLRYGAFAACLLLMLCFPLGQKWLQGDFLIANTGADTGKMETDEGTNAADNGASPTEDGVSVAEEQGTQAEKAGFGVDGVAEDTSDEYFVPNGTVISEGPELDAIYCYAAPKDGEWFCHEGVKTALKEHDGEEVYYFLAMDLFQKEEYLDTGSEAVEEELSRLRGEGYLVGIAQVPSEEDGGEMETYVAGYFTAEELENFTPNELYGYVLYFRSDEFWPTGEGIALAPLPEP